MLSSLQSKFDSLSLGVDPGVVNLDLARWLEVNTKAPDGVYPFSFEGHEWQSGVIQHPAPHKALRKASQTGGSEIIVRIILGLASLYQGTHWMYVLPSRGFASTFSTSRALPVIESSPTLSNLQSKTVRNTTMRKIGSSFVYFVGAQKARQAISVPCKGVVRDEYDFGIPSVLTTFLSRFGHYRPEERFLFDVSTPTVEGYGISEMFDEGQRNYYMLYHDKCGKWVCVEAWRDIIIPGYDGTLLTFTKADQKRPSVKVQEAVCLCPGCREPITMDNFCDPRKRAWVPMFPSREIASFQVDPLCLPQINTPVNLANSRHEYDDQAIYVNYRLGMPFSDNTNSLTLEMIKQRSVVDLIVPGQGSSMASYVFGLDVGKTCHLTIIEVSYGHPLKLVWMESIRQTGDNEVLRRVTEVKRAFNIRHGIVDVGPDITLQQSLVADGEGDVFAGEFTEGTLGLEYLMVKEEDRIVKIGRTKAISALVKEIGAGSVLFPSGGDEYNEMVAHFRAVKKVTRVTATSATKQVWTNTGADHYFFSMLYAWLAAKIFFGDFELEGNTNYIGSMVGISSVKLKDRVEERV